MFTLGKIKQYIILILITIVSTTAHSQSGKTPFYKKDYYTKIFNAEDLKQLAKINSYNVKGNSILQGAKTFDKKALGYNKIASNAKNEKAKKKAKKAALKYEKKAAKKKIKAYGYYLKANTKKYDIYSSNIKEVRLELVSEESEKGKQLEQEAKDLFSQAEVKENSALAYNGTKKAGLQNEAVMLGRKALKKLEAAFGLYMNDPEVIMEQIVRQKDDVAENTEMNKNANNKEQIIYKPDDSGAAVSKNQYTPEKKQEQQGEKTLEEQIVEKLNLTEKEKEQLTITKSNDAQANELMKNVDSMYAEIDDFREKAGNAATSKEKEEYSSEAVNLEMEAFGKLLQGINLHIKANRTKHEIYKNNIAKVRLSGSTLEARRGKMLENEAEKYFELAQQRIKQAYEQEFKSEQYTMLIEGNDMLVKVLEKYENAYGIYMNLKPLTDEDVQLLSAEENEEDDDDELFADMTDIDEARNTNENIVVEKKEENLAVRENYVVVDDYTPNNNFNFKIKETYLMQEESKKHLPYTPAKNLVFKIQIGVYKVLPKNALATLSPATCEVFEHNPFTRFYLGEFQTIETAELALPKVQAKISKDAYIVPFQEGKRISLKKARKLIVDETYISRSEYRDLSLAETKEYKTTGKISSTKSTKKTGGNNEAVDSAENLTDIDGLFYTVQLGVYKRIPEKQELLHLSPVYKDKTSKGERYTYGIFRNYTSAKKALKDVTKKGNKSAFLIAYHKGNLIKVNEAKKIEKGKKLKTKKTHKIEGLVYKVQVGEFEKPLTDEEFKLKFASLSKKWTVSSIKDLNKKLTYYTIGEFENYAEAEKVLKKVNQSNAIGIISAFKGNAKIINNEQTKKSGITYSIQVGAYSKALTKKQIKSSFANIPGGLGVDSYYEKDKKKTIYTIGKFANYADAASFGKKLKKNGINGFVVKMQDGKKSIATAKEMTAEKTKNINIRDKRQSKGSEYRIQIGALSTKIADNDLATQFPEVAEKHKIAISYDKNSGMNLYTVGHCKTYKEADALRKKLKESGISGFVVLFENNKKIPYEGVSELETKKKKVEVKKKTEKKPIKNKKKIAETKKSKDIYFRIQLASYKKELSQSEYKEKFSKLEKKHKIDVIKDEFSGNILYTIGFHQNYDKAVEEKVKLKNEGIYGFVIALRGNRKISLYEARKIKK